MTSKRCGNQKWNVENALGENIIISPRAPKASMSVFLQYRILYNVLLLVSTPLETQAVIPPRYILPLLNFRDIERDSNFSYASLITIRYSRFVKNQFSDVGYVRLTSLTGWLNMHSKIKIMNWQS